MTAIELRHAADDGDVGLGLGIIIERDRNLWPHVIPATERPIERDPDAKAGGRMTAALGLAEDEAPAKELDGVVLAEDASLDQRLVLEAGQARRGDFFHALTVARHT